MEEIREAISQTVTQIEETSSWQVKSMLIIHLKHLLDVEKATLGFMEINVGRLVER